MALTPLDFSGLDEVLERENTPAPKNQVAAVLALPIDEIVRDENQPRKTFDQTRLEELAASIKQFGVQQPIYVRPKDDTGYHKIVYGERRWRAARLAGLETIPSVIGNDPKTFSEYAQINENKQRDDLNALEIALFIQERLQNGDEGTFIAQQLGENKSYITRHLSILEAPSVIREAFDTGRLTGPNHVYELNLIYKKNPDAVIKLLSKPGEITLRQIRNITTYKDGDKADVSALDMPIVSPAQITKSSKTEQNLNKVATSQLSSSEEPKQTEQTSFVQRIVTKKLLYGTYNGQPVTVLLDRPCRVIVKYEADGNEEEIDLELLDNLSMIDAKA